MSLLSVFLRVSASLWFNGRALPAAASAVIVHDLPQLGIGPDPQGRFILGNRLRQPAGRLCQRVRQTGVRFRESRIDPQGGLVLGNRLRQAVRDARQGVCQVVMNVRAIGLNPPRERAQDGVAVLARQEAQAAAAPHYIQIAGPLGGALAATSRRGEPRGPREAAPPAQPRSVLACAAAHGPWATPAWPRHAGANAETSALAGGGRRGPPAIFVKTRAAQALKLAFSGRLVVLSLPLR